MGEVIKPRFGGERSLEGKPIIEQRAGVPEPEERPLSVAEMRVADQAFIAAHKGVFHESMRVETDIVAHIEKLKLRNPRVVTNENIDLRCRGLKGFTLEQLCDILLRSNEHNWNMEPSYYAAVICERTEHTRALGLDFG